MKYNLRYSPSASQDLVDIYNYIHAELGSPIAAERIVNQIFEKIERLQNYPDSGASLYMTTGVGSGYRFIVSGSCIIFYRRVDSEVFIDRVLNARRDYMRVLLGEALINDDPDDNCTENK